MSTEKQPTLGDGKICYLEIPATDIAVSAAFYKNVFNWNVRTRGDGSTAFDDAVTEVSGTWVTGREPHGDKGLMVHIMVNDLEKAMAAVVANGGSIVDVGKHAPELTATFRDPAGNHFSIYEQRG